MNEILGWYGYDKLNSSESGALDLKRYSAEQSSNKRMKCGNNGGNRGHSNSSTSDAGTPSPSPPPPPPPGSGGQRRAERGPGPRDAAGDDQPKDEDGECFWRKCAYMNE